MRYYSLRSSWHWIAEPIRKVWWQNNRVLSECCILPLIASILKSCKDPSVIMKNWFWTFHQNVSIFYYKIDTVCNDFETNFLLLHELSPCILPLYHLPQFSTRAMVWSLTQYLPRRSFSTVEFLCPPDFLSHQLLNTSFFLLEIHSKQLYYTYNS